MVHQPVVRLAVGVDQPLGYDFGRKDRQWNENAAREQAREQHSLRCWWLADHCGFTEYGAAPIGPV